MTAIPDAPRPEREATVAVWDPLVRVLHWTVVVAFFLAYLTEDDLLSAHTWAGYVVGAAILLRAVWGLVGPRHARFTDLLYSPGEVMRYSAELLSFRGGKRYLGHSPAGGVMVVMLLAALAVTVWSGLEVLALEEGEGPLAGDVDNRFASPVPVAGASERATHRENDDEEIEREKREGGDGEEGDESWEELHELFANLTLALVILHVAGVLLASRVHRENLIKAMFTGRKRAIDG